MVVVTGDELADAGEVEGVLPEVDDVVVGDGTP